MKHVSQRSPQQRQVNWACLTCGMVASVQCTYMPTVLGRVIWLMSCGIPQWFLSCCTMDGPQCICRESCLDVSWRNRGGDRCLGAAMEVSLKFLGAERGVLEGSWKCIGADTCLGGVLDVSWGRQGCLGGVLEVSWCGQGCLGAVLEVSWRCLGGLLWVSWG